MSLGGAFEAGSASEGRLGGQLLVELPDFLRPLPNLSVVGREGKFSLTMLSDTVGDLLLAQAPPVVCYSKGELENKEDIIATHLRLKSESAHFCLRTEVLVLEYRIVSK